MARKRLSTQDFARTVGVSDSRIRQLCLEGRIPEAEKIGRQWVIPVGARILKPPERNRDFSKLHEWLRSEDWDREMNRHAVKEFIEEGRYWIDRA